MQLRGANTTTVKDIIDLRKFILQEIETMKSQLSSMMESVDEVRVGMQEVGKAGFSAFAGHPSIDDHRYKYKKNYTPPDLLGEMTDHSRPKKIFLGGYGDIQNSL